MRQSAPVAMDAAEGRIAHNNGWAGTNGMASITWKPDTIQPIPLLPLPRVCPPKLSCHQSPVVFVLICGDSGSKLVVV